VALLACGAPTIVRARRPRQPPNFLAECREVARLIGDKSTRMGAHCTRHVEDEVQHHALL
jgi:hypothetical protein